MTYFESATKLQTNILRMYQSAPTEHRARGKEWYFHVNTLASDMGDVHTAAGVIAALSPNMRWDRNLVLASKAMAAGHIDGGTFGASLDKANLILSGSDPSEVLGSKKGFKTLNFYRNISNPDNATPVTIDRHAYDIAVGIRHGKDNRPNLGTSLKAYEVYAQAYRDVANEVDLIPHQIQAITWEWYRANLTTRR